MAGIEVESHDRVLVVAIDRPHVRNAVDRPTADALEEAFRAFDDDPDHDVAVLTGRGGDFCSGADLGAVAGDERRRNRVEPGEHAPMGPTRLLLGKPVVAAVEGHAVAGGLELALWCDLRVVGADATFGVYCRRWGVPLVDGGTVRLPRLVGVGRALDMILTGRPVLADEALRIGLADRVVDAGTALEAAVGLARDLTRFPQATLRSDRTSLYAGLDLPLADALAAEHEIGAAVIAAGHAEEGARRFADGAGRHGTLEDLPPSD